MPITYNEADVIWEVPIKRSTLQRVMNLAILATPGLDQDKRDALWAVANTADRVLANITKRENARCGCPAVMAQVGYLGVAYEDAEIGLSYIPHTDFDAFPGRFDNLVRLYIEGLQEGGTEVGKNDFGWGFELHNALRLIVTD